MILTCCCSDQYYIITIGLLRGLEDDHISYNIRHVLDSSHLISIAVSMCMHNYVALLSK